MKNEILWVLLMLFNFCGVMLFYKKFGKIGLFAWIPLSIIIANLQVVATIQLFGIYSTLGNIIYGTGYLATDILSENYGKEEAKKGVMIGFATLITFVSMMFICLQFNILDNKEPMEKLFGIMPRICLASIAAYIISQKIDVEIFHFIKKKFPNKLWLRNNLSTMFSQFLDSIIFTLIAFLGVLPTEVMIEIFISTYILKWLVAALDTPLIYWAKKQK